MNQLNSKNTQGVVTALLNAAPVVVIAVLSFFLFAGAVTKELGHDEHMYCTAGYLTAQGKVIYRDFSYVAQLPYHPLILAALYKITGTNHYLLVGRGFSVVCEVGILVCIAGICRSVLRRFPFWAAGFAIAGTVIYAMNPFVIYSCGYAWNHSAVILCVLICLWLFADPDFSRMNFLRLCVIGALLTVATFNRPTTGLVYVVFAVAIIIMAPGRLKKGKVTALPFIVGSVVFALYPLILISKAPEAFLLNVVRIPALNAAFLRQAGWVYDKAQLTAAALLSPAYFCLIVLGSYLGLMSFLQRRTAAASDKPKGRLFAAVAAAFAAIAFIPPTMWIQYWAAPVPFIVTALAYPANRLCDAAAKDSRQRRYLVGTAVMIAILAGVSLYEGLPSAIANVMDICDKDKWVPLHIHKISEDIHRKTVAEGPILTLAPLYAIEGGSQIYPQFSAGPFVYRIADRLSDSQKHIVGAAGAADLNDLINRQLPSAVVLGTEPKLLEEPILQAVVGTDWRKEVYEPNGPFAYFRNADSAPSGTR